MFRTSDVNRLTQNPNSETVILSTCSPRNEEIQTDIGRNCFRDRRQMSLPIIR